MWCLILVGLCHSIMFPAIFAMGIKGLGPLTEEASGLLIMAIAGGALVVVQGWLADIYGLQNSFWLTVACELYIFYYALWGSKPTHAVAAVRLTRAGELGRIGCSDNPIAIKRHPGSRANRIADTP